MANQRTLNLAISRRILTENVEESLPLLLRGDYQKRESSEVIVTSAGERIRVNRFQREFWDAMGKFSCVSASAPTSAGKSFLLRCWIHDYFRGAAKAAIVFLVPTRALIQEVSDAFADDLQAGALNGIGIHTLPLDADLQSAPGNIFILTQERLHILLGRDHTLRFDALIVDEAQKIGQAKLEFRPTTGAKHLSAVAFAMRCEDGGNLIYANGQAEAEKYARHISEAYSIKGYPTIEHHLRVADLIRLIGKTVHPKYALVEALKQGVAFHYGNMPLLMRVEIESLFKQNILRFLVCTSTLMEGVNLPCKVIFLRSPRRGKKIPLPPADFWNLAGRAGRWGTEFQGTIVCVDPQEWNPPVSRLRQKIRSVTEQTICDDSALLAYAEAGNRDEPR